MFIIVHDCLIYSLVSLYLADSVAHYLILRELTIKIQSYKLKKLTACVGIGVGGADVQQLRGQLVSI